MVHAAMLSCTTCESLSCRFAATAESWGRCTALKESTAGLVLKIVQLRLGKKRCNPVLVNHRDGPKPVGDRCCCVFRY